MNIEDLLREAAPGANDLFLSELPDPKDCHYTVSKRFERKMKKLLKRQKSPVLYWVQRSVACFLLVVLLGGASVLTFSAEARAAFFGWVREVYETYFVYEYAGEAQESKGIYKLAWIPDGYSETIVDEQEDSVLTIYQSEDNVPASFIYTYNLDSANMYVERDGHDIISVSVNGTPADLYLNQETEGANTIVWTDQTKGIICLITAHLSESDLIKMAESLK